MDQTRARRAAVATGVVAALAIGGVLIAQQQEDGSGAPAAAPSAPAGGASAPDDGTTPSPSPSETDPDSSATAPDATPSTAPSPSTGDEAEGDDLPDPSPGPDDSATEPAEPDPTIDPAVAERDARSALTTFLERSDEVLQADQPSVADLDTLASGFVLGEVEAVVSERDLSGLRQEGTTRIASLEVTDLDLDTDTPTVLITACLDASDLDVVDEAGTSQRGLMYLPDEPVEHRYGVTLTGDQWLVATHEIPARSTCDATEG